MTGPTVRFDQVVKRYDGVAAIDGVTVEVAAGSFVALVGASGSGKSTLLKTVNRLVVPDEGGVSIDGQDVRHGDAALLRRKIGYVFQADGLFPHMTVAENIAIVPRLGGGRAADVPALLEQVGLTADQAKRMPDALSGGQRQRVGVARALAADARLILLDEPFGALDPVIRDRICDTYRDLHDRLGLTTLMVTHDMAEALLMADRILVMAAGRVAADATPAQMLSGDAGPEAAALVEVPRRQTARLAALAGPAA